MAEKQRTLFGSQDRIVGHHTFYFDPKEMGGESLSLTTEIYDNGDGECYLNQELTLHSYFNHASICLIGTSMLPERLRQLANELDAVLTKADVMAKENKEAKLLKCKECDV